MSDFLEACSQSPANLVLSVLLLLTGGYWLVVIAGAVGMDSLDLHETAGDAHDGAGHAQPGHGHGLVSDLLEFLNVGRVPILVLWSVFILCAWAVGVLTWPIFGAWAWPMQLVSFAGVLGVSLLVMKAATLPVAALMKRMEASSEAQANLDLVGRRCKVISLRVDMRSGQVEVAAEGAPLRLYARTRDPAVVLRRGQEAVLVARDDREPVYYVTPF